MSSSSRPLPIISKFFEIQITDIAVRIQRCRGNSLSTSPAPGDVSGSESVLVRTPFDCEQAWALMAWALLLLIGIVLFFCSIGSKRHHYPSGPKAYPLIGNLLDFPAISDMVNRAQKWKKVPRYMSAVYNLMLIKVVANRILVKRTVLFSFPPHLLVYSQDRLSISAHLGSRLSSSMISTMLLSFSKHAGQYTATDQNSRWLENCESFEAPSHASGKLNRRDR